MRRWYILIGSVYAPRMVQDSYLVDEVTVHSLEHLAYAAEMDDIYYPMLF